MNKVHDWLALAAARLSETLALSSQEAALEARVLAGYALNVNHAWLLAHGRDAWLPQQQALCDTVLHRRLRGEPIAYILGRREFYGLSLEVTPAVLIPRPETETLVDAALRYLAAQGGRRVLDLGTGSGAIALALASTRPELDVVAVDRAPRALEVARRNAANTGVSHIRWVAASWFAGVEGEQFDLIVSNPPYIALEDPHLQQGDVRFEPVSALVSGLDGLQDIRHIVTNAPAYLQRGAGLLLEHGYDQAASVAAIMRGAGFSEVQQVADLSGILRVTGGRRGAEP